jgi:hypothetical protein
MGFDKTTEVAGLLNHFWLVMFTDAHLKEQAGLKYISHTWDDHPSWYLWLQECPGVYEVELQGAQAAEDCDWVAEFIIKYYPSLEEDVYHNLSILERMCRESEVFHNQPSEGPPGCSCHGHSLETDHGRFQDLTQGTGVPSHRCKTDIPPDFFYAGNLVLAFKEHASSLVKLKSLTRWSVTMTEDYEVLDYNGNTCAILHKGEVDRDYPGFALSNILYEHFVKGWGLFHSYPIKDRTICEGPGVRFYSDGKSLTKASALEIHRTIVQTEFKYQPKEIKDTARCEYKQNVYQK